MTQGNRVQSDGNGGHNINVERREWKKIIAAASLLVGLAGAGLTDVVETLSAVVRDAPRQEYRITASEADIKENAVDIETIREWMVRVEGTLVRLTDVLERLEADQTEDDK